MRALVGSISSWNWSDSDVDFCDDGNTTFFIYSMNGQVRGAFAELQGLLIPCWPKPLLPSH